MTRLLCNNLADFHPNPERCTECLAFVHIQIARVASLDRMPTMNFILLSWMYPTGDDAVSPFNPDLFIFLGQRSIKISSRKIQRRRRSPHKLFHFISFSVERKKKKSLLKKKSRLDSIRWEFPQFREWSNRDAVGWWRKKSIRIRCAVVSANRRKISSPHRQIFSSPLRYRYSQTRKNKKPQKRTVRRWTVVEHSKAPLF